MTDTFPFLFGILMSKKRLNRSLWTFTWEGGGGEVTYTAPGCRNAGAGVKQMAGHVAGQCDGLNEPERATCSVSFVHRAALLETETERVSHPSHVSSGHTAWTEHRGATAALYNRLLCSCPPPHHHHHLPPVDRQAVCCTTPLQKVPSRLSFFLPLHTSSPLE